ncbi:homocysteine S-methyltransferase family protein [Temperatibacter marinus]|uniref:Methionine synthase n=1 Tax=Temperatibacter marinus TaxID=1456591 RepID=A0AA52EC47_9PROT|nr:homocysteine S-methyltransferase family protein [Temperatibacter marinus]WND02071.1 homocysteine S-methyltransferase family protein [Temperatibacter marinus]
MSQSQLQRIKTLLKSTQDRILVMDGAMGTMLQREGLEEADFRGEAFKNWNCDLKGNNDILSITQPAIIKKIHGQFLEAGADIIETNSFNGTTISQADYRAESITRDINIAAAKVAREAADAYTEKTPDKPRYVAGAIGPTNKTLSVSPDVNNPGYREVSFDYMKEAYRAQIDALIEGGIDIVLIETVFDTLNAKAAIVATMEAFDDLGYELPIMLSCTVTDMSGRNLSGQTIDAFWYSVRHAKPFSIGLNCAFGAEHLRPHAVLLSEIADANVCVYPNAGLPNEMGEYDELPEDTAAHLKQWAEDGLLNITGGCCGTTPQHIQAIAEVVDGVQPRFIPQLEPTMRLSGLDPVTIINAAE